MISRLFWSLVEFPDSLANQSVLIRIGCGQAGLTVAARLKQVGVKTLIVDRARRIGDGWRDRYHHLVLHDPVWYVT